MADGYGSYAPPRDGFLRSDGRELNMAGVPAPFLRPDGREPNLAGASVPFLRLDGRELNIAGVSAPFIYPDGRELNIAGVSAPFLRPDGRELNIAGVSAHFPGYSPSYNPALVGQISRGGDDPLRPSSMLRQNDIPPSRPTGHGYADVTSLGDGLRPGLDGKNAGANLGSFSTSVNDPLALDRRGEKLLGSNSAGPAPLPERDHSLDVPPEGTDILFVEGLPCDCTRREVAHLFRPFIGFKDIKVIHKEPRRPGDKPSVICFVEFKDVKCAATAFQALQGYTFDDRNPDATILRIQFARFPFRPYGTYQNAH